jgi:hypothetical protein
MGRLVARGNYHAPAVSPRCARRFGGDGCLNLGGWRYTGVLLAAMGTGRGVCVSGLSYVVCVQLGYPLGPAQVQHAKCTTTSDRQGQRKIPEAFGFFAEQSAVARFASIVLYLGDSAVAPARPFTMFSRLSRQTRDEEKKGRRHDAHPLESLSRQR